MPGIPTAVLEALYTAYTTVQPPVHAKVLGKILFGKMLNTVFPNVGAASEHSKYH